jgi:hypothetical protein
MPETSAFEPVFLNTIQVWFEQTHDIFVVVRYHATAGGREYFWFSEYDAFEAMLRTRPPMADIIVFKERQAPMRGKVVELRDQALKLMPERAEWMVIKRAEPTNTSIYVSYVDTPQELHEIFVDDPSEDVAVGPYPQWHLADSETMISALIPLPAGTLRRGIY